MLKIHPVIFQSTVSLFSIPIPKLIVLMFQDRTIDTQNSSLVGYNFKLFNNASKFSGEVTRKYFIS